MPETVDPSSAQTAGDLGRGPSSAFLTTLRYSIDPVSLYRTLARDYGDGHTVHMPMLLGDVVGAISPQSAQDILTADAASFDIFSPESLAMVFRPRSVVMLSGQEHARERKLLMPPFSPRQVLANYAGTMQETALAYAAEVADGRPFVMQELAQRVLLRVVVRDVFGVTEGAELDELELRIRELFEASSPALIFFPPLRHRFGGVGPYATWERADRRLTRLIHDLIARRRAEPRGDRVDVLSLMLSARYPDGSAPSDEVLHDELMALFFAGHAATATSIAWVFYWAHRHPEVLHKLRDELAALPWDAEPARYTELPYLDAVCNETLRIYPPVADLYRKLRVPLRIGGRTVPAGTGVAVLVTCIHARPELFPEPLRFRPERFAERRYSPFEFLPYGAGARRCLGASFAHQALQVVVATILRRWELALVRREQKAVRQGVGVGPKHGVPMRVVRSLVPERSAAQPAGGRP